MSDESRRRTRKWPTWQRAVLIAMVVLLAIGVSVWWGRDYCPLCGKERKVASLDPLGLLPQWGLLLNATSRATPFSEVAEPALWDDGCPHRWVMQARTCPFMEMLRFGALGGHGRFRGQAGVYYRPPPIFFVEMAEQDRELARCYVRKLLWPYRDRAEFRRQDERLIEIGQAPVIPERLAEWRELCGLPPTNRWRAELELLPEGPSHGLRFVMEVTNVGTQSLIADRELVLGSAITALPAEHVGGEPLELIGRVPTRNPEEVLARFIVLKPGDTLTRTCDLRSGIRVFRFSIGGGRPPLGYEAMMRVRPSARVGGVQATYDVLRNLPAGAFDKYAGQSIDQLTDQMGFFPVPVEAELTFDQAGASEDGSPEQDGAGKARDDR